MRRTLVISTLSVLMLAACAPEVAEQDGQAAFAADCAGCHGLDAMGNGPVARSLGVAAPDLTGLSAANGGVFPRDRVMTIIDGLTRDPHFSNVMPEFGAGDLGDTVIVEDDAGLGTPVPVVLLALADYLEQVQR